MNTNELHEHIRKLNAQEKVKHEQRRQQALKRIRELREELRHRADTSSHTEQY